VTTGILGFNGSVPQDPPHARFLVLNTINTLGDQHLSVCMVQVGCPNDRVHTR
jgi:hypothetical protein